MKKLPAVFVVLFALSSLAALAQGNFLKKGQSGLGFSGSYAANSSASGATGTAAAVLGGIFDISFGLGWSSYGSDDLTDLKATSLSPQLRAHVIKQNSSRSPVSLSLTVGHARDNFRSPDLDAAGYTYKANSIFVSATVSRDVRLTAKSYVQPYVGLTHTSTTYTLIDELGRMFSDKGGIASFDLGLPLIYAVSWRTLLVLQPGLTLNKDVTTFSVSLGLVYVFNRPPAE
jgi:hypothetical protein